ncbi:MAG: pilus assembly protein [Eubacteriales bacterium]|nr:pilus assembly protein [Eubacteriales bacterium]
MKRKRKQELKGSYTVEAALLMGILMPVLVGIIYMGFYLHDRAFAQAAAHEAAACASLAREDKSTDISSGAQKLVKGRMLGTRGMTASVSAGTKEVTAAYEGNFQIPGMTASLFGTGGLRIRTAVVLSLERPSKRIQKIRGAVKVINSIRRKRE